MKQHFHKWRAFISCSLVTVMHINMYPKCVGTSQVFSARSRCQPRADKAGQLATFFACFRFSLLLAGVRIQQAIAITES